MESIDGEVLQVFLSRECMVGGNAQEICKWSLRSRFPETAVGEYGFARYSF